MTGYTQRLATFAAQLSFQEIPAPVIERIKELLLDTLGSMIAGASAPAVQAIAEYSRHMGPTTGRSENFVSRQGTSPLFAALSNAAAAHMVEQDDVHNGSVFHPAAVVFPPALAIAQEGGLSWERLLTACVAGYEVGIRVGEFLGRSHYEIFHTTGTAGTLASAAAVGNLLSLSSEQMLHAFGSAGTQSAGLWEFLRDAADSKQLHTSHAAAAGLTSAWLASRGFTGARNILEGQKGLAAGMSTDARVERLVAGLGTRWTVLETSFKYHASCRHTHPAADALMACMAQHQLTFADIRSVTAQVHQGAIDVLGDVKQPGSVHQSKFSMGTVLALLAKYGQAGLQEFDDHYNDPDIQAFNNNVTMVLDAEVDAAYPERWLGRVLVDTHDKGQLLGKVDVPKGDPDNPLSRPEIEAKVRRLGAYRGSATDEELDAIIHQIWNLEGKAPVARLLV